MDKIRAQYRGDWKCKEMRIRQRAVAMYFIDKVREYFIGKVTEYFIGKVREYFIDKVREYSIDKVREYFIGNVREFFIDKVRWLQFALRAGNEKDEDTADTSIYNMVCLVAACTEGRQ